MMNASFKKIMFASFFALASMTMHAQSLQITANLKNVPDKTEVGLLDGMANKEVATATAVGGKFVLTTKTENIGVYVITFKGIKIQIPIFVGNDQLTMVGDVQKLNEMVYQGSSSQELYQSFMKNLDPKMILYFNKLTVAQSEKDLAKKDSLNKLAELEAKNIIDEYVVLSKKYNQSPVTTFFLFQFANIFPTVKDALPDYYAQLQGDAKKGPFAAVIEKSIQSIGIGKMGSLMPDFKQNDVNGKPVSLSSFRGKYVLIDFWASWCGPCRKENPNVVKAYNQFHSKGFDIVGVSLDEEKHDWIGAVKKDKLTWTQVSDLKGWESQVARLYNVTAIPTNFLINGNGKILASNLRGNDLENKLQELLK